jgi:2,4-dienoyl-CoA reductase-like NADH-dependent reductase (Old Yellow Enzyme family)
MYKKLFSPVRIGRLEIGERVAMTPMGCQSRSVDECVPQNE